MIICTGPFGETLHYVMYINYGKRGTRTASISCSIGEAHRGRSTEPHFLPKNLAQAIEGMRSDQCVDQATCTTIIYKTAAVYCMGTAEILTATRTNR